MNGTRDSSEMNLTQEQYDMLATRRKYTGLPPLNGAIVQVMSPGRAKNAVTSEPLGGYICLVIQYPDGTRLGNIEDILMYVPKERLEPISPELDSEITAYIKKLNLPSNDLPTRFWIERDGILHWRA